MKIEIEVEDVTDDLFLLQDLGSGTYGKRSFKVASVIPGGAPHITYGGQRYLVSIRRIVEAVCNAHNQEEKIKNG